MSRLGSTASWIMAGTILLVAVVWSNLTALGIGANPLTYDDVALPRLVVATLGTLTTWLLISVMVSRGFKLAWDPVWAVLGALAAWSAVSGAFAGTTLVWLGQSERLEGVLTMVLYALLYGAGLQLGGSKRCVRSLAIALAIGSLILSLHGLLQVAQLDPTNYLVSGYSFYLGSAFASLGNPNFLAGLLVLALPIVVALAMTAEKRRATYVWWVSVVIVVFALYATYSQGAWLAVMVEVAVAIAWFLWSRQASARDAEKRPKRSFIRVAWPAALVLLIGIAVIIGVTGIATQRGLRLWGSSLSETGSGRILLAQTTLSAVAERPLFGYGPDNFLEAFRVNRPDRYVEVFGQNSLNANAHSWIGQFASTTGILGALLLGVALLWGLTRGRPRRDGAEGEPADLLSTAIWIGAIGFVVQMMLNVAVLASTVPFWLLMGVIAAPHARRVEISKVVARVSVAAFAVLIAASTVGSGFLLAADSAFLESRRVYNGDATGNVAMLAERAVSMNPLSVKYSRALAQARASLVLNAILQANRPSEEVRALYEDAGDAFEATSRLSSRDYAALSWLAGLQAATGTHLEDAELLAEARKTAQRAEQLDATHASVIPLLEGDTSDSAARRALLVPGLP